MIHMNSFCELFLYSCFMSFLFKLYNYSIYYLITDVVHMLIKLQSNCSYKTGIADSHSLLQVISILKKQQVKILCLR